MLEEVIRKEFIENRKQGMKDGIKVGRESGMKSGIKVGIKNGKEQERRKTINRMHKLGFDVKQISEILGISNEEVNRMLIKKF